MELTETLLGNSFAAIRSLDVSEAISPRDRMFRLGQEEHYFGVGRSAILAIATALLARAAHGGGDGPIRRVLDLGCGHGRVARYLRAAFSHVHVTDFDRDGIDWCVDALGCIEAAEPLDSETYDLIWLGSVFTHLPKESAISLLELLKRMLAENGVVIFSAQGRFGTTSLEAAAADPNATKLALRGLEAGAAKSACENYRQSGFGFSAYPRQNDYGIAMATAEWFREHVLDENFLQLLFLERGYDSNQDVHAFMRKHLMYRGKGPLYSSSRKAT